jgi:Protein of unknown function (DUF1552)
MNPFRKSAIRRSTALQAIPRRTMLRGAGVLLGLPLLEAMIPRRSLAAVPAQVPKRLAVLYMPNGVHPGAWTPLGQGRDFVLSPTLLPLQDLRNEILVLTNLWHKNSDFGDGHYVKTSGFLTGTTIQKTAGYDLNCHGVSLDQVVAKQIGTGTPLPSLELGAEPVRTGVDATVGYTQLYGGHIAWSAPTIPLAKEIDPKLAWERIVRATSPDHETTRRTASILDCVLDDAHQLRRSLGTQDQGKLDEYLQSVHQLETQVGRFDDTTSEQWRAQGGINPNVKPDWLPEGPPTAHAERVELLLDVMALAFQMDATRVCTFMFGNAVSSADFSFLDGVKGTHHDLSHHNRDAAVMAQYQKVNRWHVSQFARLLQKLKAMKEGEGTVLDNSLLLFGSGLRDGNAHDPHNLPVILAGRGGGSIPTGQHLVSRRDTPLANLYVDILRALDIPADQFADSSGPLLA